MRTVVFDLDGTLADTSGDLIAAANHCFREMGHGDVLDPASDAGVALRGGRMMLTTGLMRLGRMEQAVVDQYYPVLLAAYGEAISSAATPWRLRISSAASAMAWVKWQVG